ncbi:hypothetical protein SDC9_99778 [bioreactor metagenome]|uniref:DUF3098 domain-containing protein n=1 Tax=bioreactor metagenome TaxID=1076179 RepID=A0A645ATV8_9ZZZZ
MSHKNLAFHKMNLIICGVAVLIIIVGFLLMSGPATTFEGFEPDIFSVRRIKVAPVVCLAGFVLMIFGILYPAKERKEQV